MTPLEREQRRYELAKAAMSAIIAKAHYRHTSQEELVKDAAWFADGAFLYADAMLRELDKTELARTGANGLVAV